MSFRRRWLPIVLAGLFIWAMVTAAAVSDTWELLFPEAAAILCGAWIQPAQAWNVDRPRMLALMAIGSVAGVAMNLWLPAPLVVKAPLGFAFVALTMHVFAADMTPMVSAVVLPLLLGTTDWLYPVAVVVIVMLICAGQVILEHLGLREPIAYTPLRLPAGEALRSWGRRLAVFCVLALPAYALRQPFFAVPPLLVVYTELSRPDNNLRRRPLRGIGVLVCAALIGAGARAAADALAAAGWGNLGYIAVTPVAYALLVVAWDRFRTWLPPAGAVVLLALLAPVSVPVLYALEAPVGACVWVAAALFCFKGASPEEQDDPTHPARRTPDSRFTLALDAIKSENKD